MNVSIIGVTGYSGIALLKILLHHPVFKIQSVYATKGERSLIEEYPHLTGFLQKNIEPICIDKIAETSELVFLATPSGVSSKLVEQFYEKNIKVIDLSGDLRLKEEGEYERWYQKEGAKPYLLNEAVYGLTEWNKEKISKAKIIANPGCYATASLLALAPVVKNQLVETSSIIIDGKSGVSGAGRKATQEIMFSEMNENLKIYKVNKHQHIPEIESQLREWDDSIQPITFSTHLIPITRGIMITAYVQLKERLTTEEVLQLYEETYLHHPFIRIRPFDTYPAVKEVLGTNFCDIGLNVDPRTNRITIISVIDNLMKGAAGQGVQNANLLFHLPEETGLKYVPQYP